MTEAVITLEDNRRTMIAGAPEGVDARVLARLARQGKSPILHVCRDDARMSRLVSQLGFYAPGISVLDFPAWDTVPYDRTSPNTEIVARRISTLATLTGRAPDILVTTVSALLQRVPPRALFRSAVVEAAPGDRLALEQLQGVLERNGYHRAGTVREPGEYAIRGGIVDVFPPGVTDPLRLDFFGDELEGIRSFDPVTQRTTDRADRLYIAPVSEVLLDEASIQRFRSRYRELFGTGAADDPLYEAVADGRRAIGVEHWLPLFHEGLETLFDYLPGAALTLDHQADAAIEARFDLIVDYYEARLHMLPQNARQAAASDPSTTYRPVEPKSLFLEPEELKASLAARPSAEFSPYPRAEGQAAQDARGRLGRDFTEARKRSDVSLFDAVRERIEGEGANRLVLVAGRSDGTRDRLLALLKEHGLAELVTCESWEAAAARPDVPAVLVTLELDRGFEMPDVVVLSEQDILGDRLARPARRRRRAEAFINEVSALAEGDLVVHVDHGIGRYEGLETLKILNARHDCLRVIYAGGDKLYVPVESIEVLSRFGSEDSEAQLDRLGAPAWQARKAKVKERLKEIAAGLLRTAAERAMRRGEPLEIAHGTYEEFCARFPWSETEDQQRAIDETVHDLSSGQPMDRLICGDVGFGKTEVAMRAAFVAAMDGKQVAMIVPTTLLARQHYQAFRERFEGFPLRVEQLSRLVAGAAATEVRKGIADGTVDVVIGTHTLLSKSVNFNRLGLVIIDEEQHFGVAQKERLKQLKSDVHVLTLTATPIPRTLQMALSGVREMSVIATPPVDRLAVRTFVLPYDPVVVREAIQRERYRGGQCFYVCPRVADLDRVRHRVAELVPDAKLAVAHGQMATKDLESVMSDFIDGKYDILISTNIVEAGIDIPTANTMLIHRADRFGLAQLYQLRGRIGRSKTRGYAYLTLPPGQIQSETAKRRLDVMQALDTLGAGFTLASHDLDIRGAGNLLGEEQSGQVREVGAELYQQMLEDTIADMRAEQSGAPAAAKHDSWTPEIQVGTSILIPEQYVQDLSVRLGLYRRISLLVDSREIEAFAAELIDRFGPLPDEVENLLQIIAIKQLCFAASVEKLEAGPKGAVLSLRDNSFPNPEGLVAFMQKRPNSAKLRPDHKLVFMQRWPTPKERVTGVRKLMTELAAMAKTEGPRKKAKAG